MNIAEALTTMSGLYAAAYQLRLSLPDTDADIGARQLAHQWRNRLYDAAAGLGDQATRTAVMNAVTELRTIAETERRREIARDALRKSDALAPLRRRYNPDNEEQLTAASARYETLCDRVVAAFGEGFEL